MNLSYTISVNTSTGNYNTERRLLRGTSNGYIKTKYNMYLSTGQGVSDREKNGIALISERLRVIYEYFRDNKVTAQYIMLPTPKIFIYIYIILAIAYTTLTEAPLLVRVIICSCGAPCCIAADSGALVKGTATPSEREYALGPLNAWASGSVRYTFPSRRHTCWANLSISHIPLCTSPISNNAPFCNRNVHISGTKWCIVGYLLDVLWDLWNGSLGCVSCGKHSWGSFTNMV